jgi:hypothetical protein
MTRGRPAKPRYTFTLASSSPANEVLVRSALGSLSCLAKVDAEIFIGAVVEAAGHYLAASRGYETPRKPVPPGINENGAGNRVRLKRRTKYHVAILLYDCMSAWHSAGGSEVLWVSDDNRESPPVQAARALLSALNGKNYTGSLRQQIEQARLIKP